jgi:hypothetical protein
MAGGRDIATKLATECHRKGDPWLRGRDGASQARQTASLIYPGRFSSPLAKGNQLGRSENDDCEP